MMRAHHHHQRPPGPSPHRGEALGRRPEQHACGPRSRGQGVERSRGWQQCSTACHLRHACIGKRKAADSASRTCGGLGVLGEGEGQLRDAVMELLLQKGGRGARQRQGPSGGTACSALRCRPAGLAHAAPAPTTCRAAPAALAWNLRRAQATHSSKLEQRSLTRTSTTWFVHRQAQRGRCEGQTGRGEWQQRGTNSAPCPPTPALLTFSSCSRAAASLLVLMAAGGERQEAGAVVSPNSRPQGTGAGPPPPSYTHTHCGCTSQGRPATCWPPAASSPECPQTLQRGEGPVSLRTCVALRCLPTLAKQPPLQRRTLSSSNPPLRA